MRKDTNIAAGNGKKLKQTPLKGRKAIKRKKGNIKMDSDLICSS